MAYAAKENSGSLFKNTRKETESHPNATGSALIDGVEYWVSAWTKKDKNNNLWQSLAFKRKDATPARKQERDDRSIAEQIDDSVPF